MNRGRRSRVLALVAEVAVFFAPSLASAEIERSSSTKGAGTSSCRHERRAVIAEVESNDRVRRISVKPGDYYLRSCARDHLLEGAARSHTHVSWV